MVLNLFHGSKIYFRFVHCKYSFTTSIKKIENCPRNIEIVTKEEKTNTKVPALWNHGMLDNRNRNIRRSLIQTLREECRQEMKFTEDDVKKEKNSLSINSTNRVPPIVLGNSSL